MAEVTLRCARCEYDLRMIDAAGVCPECALPIETSVAAARELSTVAAYWWGPGARVLASVVLMRVLFTTTVVVWDMINRRQMIRYMSLGTLHPWPFEELVPVVDRIFTAQFSLFVRFLLGWWMLICVAQFVGLWMLTEPMRQGDRGRWLRLAARWTPLVMLLVFVVLRFGSAGRAWMIYPYRQVAVFVMMAAPTVLMITWSARVAAMVGVGRHVITVGAAAAVGGLIFAIDDAVGVPQRGNFLSVAAAVAYLATAAMGWLWLAVHRRTRRYRIPA